MPCEDIDASKVQSLRRPQEAGKFRSEDAYAARIAVGRVDILTFISHPIDPTRHHGMYAIFLLLDR